MDIHQTEDMEITENVEINQNGFIPIPQIIKDTLLLGGFIALTIFSVISYMGRWRRQILEQDQMTIEFQRIRQRANELTEHNE